MFPIHAITTSVANETMAKEAAEMQKTLRESAPLFQFSSKIRLNRRDAEDGEKKEKELSTNEHPGVSCFLERNSGIAPRKLARGGSDVKLKT
jgi:hypothetical protein